MNFHDLDILMQRTLLRAEVGQVTILSHSLELNLLLILCIVSTTTENEFEKQYEKKKTLGKIIGEIKPLNIFDQKELAELDKAKASRNEFIHRLSDRYTNSIKNSGTMYELLLEFRSIAKLIEESNEMVYKKLGEMAEKGGVNTVEMQALSKKTINNWENA